MLIWIQIVSIKSLSLKFVGIKAKWGCLGQVMPSFTSFTKCNPNIHAIVQTYMYVYIYIYIGNGAVADVCQSVRCGAVVDVTGNTVLRCTTQQCVLYVPSTRMCCVGGAVCFPCWTRWIFRTLSKLVCVTVPELRTVCCQMAHRNRLSPSPWHLKMETASISVTWRF